MHLTPCLADDNTACFHTHDKHDHTDMQTEQRTTSSRAPGRTSSSTSILLCLYCPQRGTPETQGYSAMPLDSTRRDSASCHTAMLSKEGFSSVAGSQLMLQQRNVSQGASGYRVCAIALVGISVGVVSNVEQMCCSPIDWVSGKTLLHVLHSAGRVLRLSQVSKQHQPAQEDQA